MRISALLLVLPTVLAAQSIATTVPPLPSNGGAKLPTAVQASKPEDLCAVSGEVLNGISNEPLRRATLVLTRADPTPGDMGPPLSYTTSSNANGQFAMKD